VETSGAALVDALRSVPGQRRLCLEEGTQSQWLYEILSPHVSELGKHYDRIVAAGTKPNLARLTLAQERGRGEGDEGGAVGGASGAQAVEADEVLVGRCRHQERPHAVRPGLRLQAHHPSTMPMLYPTACSCLTPRDRRRARGSWGSIRRSGADVDDEPHDLLSVTLADSVLMPADRVADRPGAPLSIQRRECRP
jgi:hypothetical protein